MSVCVCVFVSPPGVSSLISLVVSAQGEEQPRLNVMLCEAVVAVYLSLLIHGLGMHSGNELFRLAAHPLNNRMWAAVFGGGAKVIIKPKRPSESPGRQAHIMHALPRASIHTPQNIHKYTNCVCACVWSTHTHIHTLTIHSHTLTHLLYLYLIS